MHSSPAPTILLSPSPPLSPPRSSAPISDCRGVNPGSWGVATIGGDLAPSLGGRKKISQTKISERRFLVKIVHFHGQNF